VRACVVVLIAHSPQPTAFSICGRYHRSVPSPSSRTVQQLVLFFYLTVTTAGFIFTMTRLEIPLIPKLLVWWSYGMMAPYQGDRPWNGDFLYEGQLADGSWVPIDITPYMPYEFGERNVRKHLKIYKGELRVSKFTEFALMLLDRERARGTPYRSVRITYEQWPRSNGGYDFLRVPTFMTRSFITQVQ
jgi:hypothetical protein